MLDTNIVSDLISRPQGHVGARVDSLEPDMVVISIVVASELLFGAERKQSIKLTSRVREVLSSRSIVPLGDAADRHYAELRTRLERQGKLIGATTCSSLRTRSRWGRRWSPTMRTSGASTD